MFAASALKSESLERNYQALIRMRATRIALAGMAAGGAILVAPWAPLLVWFSAVLFWERAIWPPLWRAWVQPLLDHATGRAERRHAAFVFTSAALYCVLPLLAWAGGGAAGAAIATAWLGIASIQVFLHHAAGRLQFFAGLAPLILVALMAPMLQGVTLQAALCTLFTYYLMMCAGIIASERRRIFNVMDEQERALCAAEEADKLKTQFLTTVSHELRTPLNAILGYAELLQEDIEDGAGDCEDVARVRDSGRRLLQLIDRILDMGRLEAGKAALHATRIDLASFVQAAADEFRQVAAENGNCVSVRIDVECDALMIDAEHLSGALRPLIENACKYTKRGAISIHARRVNDRMCIDVMDTGVGIAPEAVDFLFKPFSQGDGSVTRAYEGAGLGLAIARGMARALGGDISFTSALGKGTTFTLSVPFIAPASASENAQMRAA